jgi:transposase InsO family protein
VRTKADDADDQELLEKIKAVKLRRPAWGYRRVRAWLKKRLGRPLNRKRVYRLMKTAGLLVKTPSHKASRTPQKDKPRSIRKNQWWGTDMTKFYVQTVGWVYLVLVLDWFTKKIAGYQVGLRPNTSFWLQALHMAIQSECPAGSRSYGLHLMSDNGSQPTSIRYEKELETLGIDHVTTSYSNPKGNADTERVFRTFKEDTIWPNEFDSYDEARAAVDEWVRFYNTEYPHSSLGELSPIEFEQQLERQAA